MKRFFLVAAAVGLLAGVGAWGAQDMCLWGGDGGCWKLDSPARVTECERDAWHFDGGKEGEGTFCQGGTFVKGKTNTPPTGGGSVTPVGCCDWNLKGKCYNIYDADDVANCHDEYGKLYDGACPGTEGECPGGGGVVNPPTVKDMCLWDASGQCWPVPDAATGKTVADCEREAWHFKGGTQGADTYCSGGTFVAGKTSTPPDGSTPAVPLGCCKWADDNPAGNCWNIYEEQEKSDCNYTPNQYWAGSCPGTDGTCPSGPPDNIVDGIRHFGSKAPNPNLRVFYAKGRVSVNWTPSAKISKGTVQLINAKGVALSTAFIKANSGKVSVKLGTVGVPTGMYFVHIDAVGQNGKRIVSQSAVSIVK